MKTLDTIKTLLAAALDADAQAKTASTPEDNPYVNHTTRELAQGKGVLKASDQTPALDMTVKASPRNSDIVKMNMEWAAEDPEAAENAYLEQWTNAASHQVERVRRAGLADGKVDLSAKRMAAARARAERKAQFDAIAADPVMPDPKRLGAAWLVVLPMASIVEKIAASKARWGARYLGTLVDDIPQVVIEAMVLVLAKSDQDLDVLKVAAQELGGEVERTGKIPGEQVSDEDRKERRQIALARKWLMGMANNRVMGALTDAYTEQRNLRWGNIDIIATVMTSISGVGEDPLVSRHQADKPPSMLGSRFQRPGGLDPHALSTVITGAITERRLDALVEMLLNEDNRRTDGAFKWADNAEAVFLASADGVFKWDLVKRATAHLANPRRARADAARAHVRSTFEFLPSLIVEAVRCFEYDTVEVVAFVDGQFRAHVQSHFDTLIERGDGRRRPIVPGLRYSSPEEAAAAIVEHLSILVTGDDIAASVAYA